MLNLRALLLASTIPAAPFVSGCATDVDASPVTEASTSELAAIVSVESTSYANEEAMPHATAVARFIRTREGAVDTPTLEMLGAAVDLPPNGSCLASMPSSQEGARAAELLDFGAVSIEASGKTTWLTPRHVPDVTDLISGVVYAARMEGDDVPTSGPLSIRVNGTGDLQPFSMSTDRVGAPSNVAFDGTPYDVATPLSFSAAMDVLVTWSPDPGDDTVYFEIEGGGGETATCACDDLGTATLPSALFARDGGLLTIHRLHRERVFATGIDEGEARFDFSRAYLFTSADLNP